MSYVVMVVSTKRVQNMEQVLEILKNTPVGPTTSISIRHELDSAEQGGGA